MDTENRNANIPTKLVKTPMKSAAKGMETPNKAVRPNSSASCSKLTCSTPKTPFSPTSSVNTVGSSAREAARIAKLQSTVERINKVAELKEKWAKDKEMKHQINVVKRAIEFKKLQDDNYTAAEKRKHNLEKQKEFSDRQKHEKKEILASSLQARTQLADDLQKEAKAKRRISVFLNKKMMQRAKAKEVEMETEKKQFEVELLASRRFDHLELREAKKAEETRKRESLAMRGEAARIQKQVADELARKAHQEELDLLETRRNNWEDDKKAKSIDDQRKRESLAGRLDQWRKQRTVQEQEKADESEQQRDLAATRHQDWEDVQAYKAQQLNRDRMSLADRLTHWREVEKVKEDEEERKAKEAAAADLELTEQARKDVEKYQAQLKANARMSIAFRAHKAMKDRQFDEGQKAFLTDMKAMESSLAKNDHDALTEYNQHEAYERRQSMVNRNYAEAKERQRLKQVREQEQKDATDDFNNRANCWADVKKYQEEQRAIARKSLAWRIAETSRKHELDLAEHTEKMAQLHMDFELKHMDWEEVQKYKASEQDRRRKSMMLRTESWRMQRMAEAKLQAKKEMIADEEARLREQDREALLTAKATLAAEQRANAINSSVVL